jgi:hypothetical protein
MNTPIVSTFQKGWSFDIDDNLEQPGNITKGVNGRIYSVNGKYAFNFIEGSKVEYENENIVAYLGAHSFKDEFLAFCKILKTEDLPTQTTEEESYQIATNVFTLESATDTISLVSEFTDNSDFITNTVTVTVTDSDPNDFEINYSEIPNENDEVNLGEYYNFYTADTNRVSCPINLTNIPPNNSEYFDALFLFSKDDNGNLVGKLIWYGYQNWPLNAKITTEGVEENQFNKKVYYTDAFNPRRVVNIKDNRLLYRQGEEFNQVINNTLLEPLIDAILPAGQLPAMNVFYVYRVISENGQVSSLSPASEMISILDETEAIEFAGGQPQQNTGKRVSVKVNLLNNTPNEQVECFAIEYEALGAPTGIKRLGLRPASSVVFFEHLGSEPTSTTLTIDDLVNNLNTWKYCNDFNSEKNKLIAGGLRNDPLPTIFNQLDYLMPLHAWNKDGETHNSIYNPEPWNYRQIDPTVTDSMYTVEKKVYYTVSVYGPTTVTLKNKETGEIVSINFNNLPIDRYTDITEQLAQFLLFEQDNNINWETYFPNLTVISENGQIIFERIDELVLTNIDNYVFESTNNQFIEEVDSKVVFVDPGVNASNLVWGGQSIGFNDGVGIRVTYREVKEPLLNQALAEYDGSDSLLDYETPSLEKYGMKGEIYRLGFEGFNLDSTPLFVVPLGDIMIPNIGDFKAEIDNSGNPILTNVKYTNQSVEEGVLYGHGIKLHIEVRLSCELQEFLSMYRLVYVERTNNDRTIIAQGISAPLVKIQDDYLPDNRIPEPLLDKWTLPYYGGPVYEKPGFENYDLRGENYQYSVPALQELKWFERVMQHRRLMYFDAPDLYYSRVSSELIEDSQIQILGKLRTDHTPEVIMNRGTDLATIQAITSPFFGSVYYAGEEVYPKFSRKIKEPYVANVPNLENLPQGSGSENYIDHPDMYFINCSVYSNFVHEKRDIGIEFAKAMNRGEVVSGNAFGVTNGVSNNALCLPYQPWYFGTWQRQFDYHQSNDPGRSRHQLYKTGLTSKGYNTVFLKAEEDVFTDEFAEPWLPSPNPQIREEWDRKTIEISDAVPLINLFKNNQASVYGGRSREAYTRNRYIPLSKSIPVLKSSNDIQYFDVGIDVYVSLNIRIKNDFSNEEQSLVENVRNGDDGLNRDGSFTQRKRQGAWMYAVVLETQVEPKMTADYETYKSGVPHKFDQLKTETINPAYFSIRDFKKSIVKPFNYKDDPNQINEVAISDVKVAGEPFDNWTLFKPNNIYPLLDKNKGAVTNLIKFENQVFAIQEHQTSQIYVGVDRLVTDNNGQPINIKQGSGTIVEGHNVLSEYGTSIRRAVAKGEDGFAFYDERKNEFVYNNTPIFIERDLSLHMLERYKSNRVINSEAYYDPEKKEININIKTKNGITTMISFNEALKLFNGEYEIDSNLFVKFDNNVFVPKVIAGDNPLSKDLHKLNYGNFLNLLGEQKEMKLGVTINGGPDKVIQHRELEIVSNSNYGMKSIFAESNIGYSRTILPTHVRYRIREGVHSVPLIPDTIKLDESGMVRGSNIDIEITAESIENSNVKISALIHGVRISHR